MKKFIGENESWIGKLYSSIKQVLKLRNNYVQTFPE